MLRDWLKVLTAETDPRVIMSRSGESPYLTRWYLLGLQRTPDPERAGQLLDDAPEPTTWWERLGARSPVNVFLHRFHRSDEDVALHNHPWAWGLAFVLVGGYVEERRVGDRVLRRKVKPWRFNLVTAETFHRVDLLEEDAWTLFIAGPKRATWYFWDREKLRRAPWREFIDEIRKGIPAGWKRDSREGGVTLDGERTTERPVGLLWRLLGFGPSVCLECPANPQCARYAECEAEAAAFQEAMEREGLHLYEQVGADVRINGKPVGKLVDLTLEGAEASGLGMDDALELCTRCNGTGTTHPPEPGGACLECGGWGELVK